MSSRYRALTGLAVLMLGACAAEPPPAIRYGGDAESLALNEARAIEAARRHPNAQPRVRPQFPEAAPPPLPAGTNLPPPLHITRRSAPNVDSFPPLETVRERVVYADTPYRYGYGYGYRRPFFGARFGWDPYGYGYASYGYGRPFFGVGYGWDPYGYGYYPARYRYGYGLGLGSPLWAAPHRHHHFGSSPRLGWDGPRYHHHGGRLGPSLNVRSVFTGSHRRR